MRISDWSSDVFSSDLAVNIKLDKAGGVTEAMRLAEKARERGLDVMIGCMLGTSLGIAPAFLRGQQAKWVDLDGAMLLEKDRKGALTQKAGVRRPGELGGMGEGRGWGGGGGGE